MKRIFSGAKTPDFPAPPRFFSSGSPGESSPKSPGGRSRSSSFSKIFSGSNSPKSPVVLPQESSTTGNLSPELVPIVTLLSAHAHRRYHEGVFLILQDLKNDGSPASRKWQKVYGVLIGTQLALWDAEELSECNSDMANVKLKEVASKPHYVNFTDATLRPIDKTDAVFTESKKKLENALVVSTTLKNRYFLQYSDKESFTHWNAAIRLSLFEFTSLQEAYTGAFLSSRGAKLGDIKIILSSSKFDYEDWVSVRFGTGMPWKRCYAVISQSSNKKNPFGKIKFYENDKKNKKTNAMATVVSSKAVYAVYPSSALLIDTSTIVKLEGEISFDKKSSSQETNIFIMPEKHQAVPGYDTIIRFLIPAMNAFKLYGRPKKLIANKDDQNSLLFALPTLPHVHYLKVEDLLALSNSASSLQWSAYEWRDHIRDILQKKLPHGYSGCGSSTGITGALSSPVIASAELFDSSRNPSSPTFLPKLRTTNDSTLTLKTSNTGSHSTLASGSPLGKQSFKLSPASTNADKQSTSSVSEPNNYKSPSLEKLGPAQDNAVGNMAQKQQSQLRVNIGASNYDRLAVENTKERKDNPIEKYSNASELSALYDKYSASPFGKSPGRRTSPISQTIHVNDHKNIASPYTQYVGSSEGKTFEISNVRDSASSSKSNEYHSQDEASNDSFNDDIDALQEFSDLAKTISEIGIETSSISKHDKSNDITLDTDLNFNTSYENGYQNEEDNVFDPDYVEQNHMLETDSVYNASDGSSVYTSVNEERNRTDIRSGSQQGIANQSTNRIPHSLPISDMKRVNYPTQNTSQREPQAQQTYTNSYVQNSQVPAREQGRNVNPYSSRQIRANPVQNMPGASPSHSPQYQQFPQGYKGPSPSRSNHPKYNQPPAHILPQQPYGSPQNFLQQHPQQQSYPVPLPYTQHQKYQPQKPYPQPQQHMQGGRPHNRIPNGPSPGQAINPGGMRQQAGPIGAPNGTYPSFPNKAVSNQKPRPPPNGGFSQFMPSAASNPYSR